MCTTDVGVLESGDVQGGPGPCKVARFSVKRVLPCTSLLLRAFEGAGPEILRPYDPKTCRPGACCPVLVQGVGAFRVLGF